MLENRYYGHEGASMFLGCYFGCSVYRIFLALQDAVNSHRREFGKNFSAEIVLPLGV